VGFHGTLYASPASYIWYKQHYGVTKAADIFYSIPISRQAGLVFAEGLRIAGIPVVYYGGGSDQGENPAAPTYDTDVVQMRNKGMDILVNAIDRRLREGVPVDGPLQLHGEGEHRNRLAVDGPEGGHRLQLALPGLDRAPDDLSPLR